MDEFIERRIVTGLIVSRIFTDRIRKFWDSSYMESDELRRVAVWCLDYYDAYGDAPDKDIQTVYTRRLSQENVPEDEAEYIERMLKDLSDEYGRESQFNADYLFDQAVEYFKSQKLAQHQREVEKLREAGQVDKAEELARNYEPTLVDEANESIDLSSDEALDRMEAAFDEQSLRVISYPGALGRMMNEHLVRGGFVAYLAKEKAGKSWFKLDMAMRAVRQKANVAFFQAGDMTEDQQMKRIGTYLTKRSYKERYCTEYYYPVGDCIYNQLDLCSRDDRNCDFGIYEGVDEKQLWESRHQYFNYDALIKKSQEYPDYTPCDSHACAHRRGSVWMIRRPPTEPIDGYEARRALKRYFKRYRRGFRLATYPSDSLTVNEMRRQLDKWEKKYNFIADVIICDHADLLDEPGVSEFRHKEFAKWKGLRSLSQERHALMVTSTWADADSYYAYRLNMGNFSEDKRKLGEVTAMWGLNKSPDNREKRMGITRVNEVVIREGEFADDNEVTVLQDLRAGRPVLESF